MSVFLSLSPYFSHLTLSIFQVQRGHHAGQVPDDRGGQPQDPRTGLQLAAAHRNNQSTSVSFYVFKASVTDPFQFRLSDPALHNHKVIEK